MRLGISSYTYVWSVGVPGYPQPEQPLDAFGLVDLAISLGVRVVQLCDNLPLDLLDEEERRSLMHRGRQAGIAFEIGTSGLDPDRLRRWLALAVEFGSPFLRLVLDAADDQPTADEAVDALRRILPEFDEAGMTLAIENHDRFPAGVLLRMLERIGSPRLGICFDTANSIGCLESAEHVLKTLGPHVVNVHIKDYALFRPVHNKGFLVEGRPAGQGDLDIPRLVSEIRSYGRDPNLIVELWPPPQDSLEESIALERRWAEESVRYMRTTAGVGVRS